MCEIKRKTHEGHSWVKMIFIFLIQFLKTEKFGTQLFVQKHSSVLGIRDHAFLSFFASQAHQLQSAELQLTTKRQD